MYWHDGNLIEVSFHIDGNGESKLIVTGNFYENDQSPKRGEYKILCVDVTKHNLCLDVVELKDNIFAGNISNGYLKGNTLWLYFTDGILEVIAKNFEATKC